MPTTGAINPSKAQVQKPRGAQGYNARQGHKSRTPKKETPIPPSNPKLSSKGFTPLYKCNTHHHKPSGAAPEITFRVKVEFLPSSVGHGTECRRKIFWYCTGLIMRYLGEEPKEGKRKVLGDLGRNKCRKIEG